MAASDRPGWVSPKACPSRCLSVKRLGRQFVIRPYGVLRGLWIDPDHFVHFVQAAKAGEFDHLLPDQAK